MKNLQKASFTYSLLMSICIFVTFSFQYFIIFSRGKYLKESLKMSVNAVDTKSLISGLISGKTGCHALLMKKPTTFSITLIPPNRSLMFKSMSPSRSMKTLTFKRPPGPPSLLTIVVWLYLYNVIFQLPDAFNGFPSIFESKTYWPSNDFSGKSCE